MIQTKDFSEIIGKHKGQNCLIVGSGPSLDELQPDFWHTYDVIICNNLILYTPCDYLLRPDDIGHNVLSLLDGCLYRYFRKRLHEEDAFERDGRIIHNGDTICACASLAVELGVSSVDFAGCDFSREDYCKRRLQRFPDWQKDISDKAFRGFGLAKEGLISILEHYGVPYGFLK